VTKQELLSALEGLTDECEILMEVSGSYAGLVSIESAEYVSSRGDSYAYIKLVEGAR